MYVLIPIFVFTEMYLYSMIIHMVPNHKQSKNNKEKNLKSKHLLHRIQGHSTYSTTITKVTVISPVHSTSSQCTYNKKPANWAYCRGIIQESLERLDVLTKVLKSNSTMIRHKTQRLAGGSRGGGGRGGGGGGGSSCAL